MAVDSVWKRLLKVPALTDVFLSSYKIPVYAWCQESVFLTVESVCLAIVLWSGDGVMGSWNIDRIPAWYLYPAPLLQFTKTNYRSILQKREYSASPCDDRMANYSFRQHRLLVSIQKRNLELPVGECLARWYHRWEDTGRYHGREKPSV